MENEMGNRENVGLMRAILGSYWGNIGVVLGLYWG